MNTTTTMGAACGTTGHYARDGRERCACGSLANPAGFCCEWGTPITVPIDNRTTVTDWLVVQVHTPCMACDECATDAIATARVTGSVEASHHDGNHAARVVRREVVR